MIGSRLRALVTVLLAGLILAGPALAPAVAQDKILDASSTDEIVRLLKGYGDAEAVSDGKDGIVAKGRVAETDFTVRQIECRDSQCRGLQFVAAVSRLITEQQANAWNRDKRFGRVLRDELGEARLELAYDMTGGVSAANFADRIDWWVVALKDFIKFLDQPVEEEPKDEPNRSAATDPDDDDPLDEDDATPDPAYSDTTVLTDKASIAEAQEHLSDLGYYEGTFDGKMGKGTEQA
ncbi:MAG: YbjN domain-containing protein, partial [Hyphomicrobiaceae bacterium]|nr:YbjN domain-containing protein [Hyphomicrobiaceae bacterium]